MNGKEERRYCHGERRVFSIREFEWDDEWGWVHSADPKHTEMGTLIEAPMKFEETGGM